MLEKTPRRSQIAIEGSEHLLPQEALNVFNYLMSKGTIWDFQFAVLICVMINSYTRNDDITGKRKQIDGDIS